MNKLQVLISLLAAQLGLNLVQQRTADLLTPKMLEASSYWSMSGADCKVSNTRMFQGQSFEGGTFESQLVRWSAKIVRELPSFSSFIRSGGQLLSQSVIELL